GQAEVYEVATFYAHFDVGKEGEAMPPPATVRVCDSLTCELFGAQKLLKYLEGQLGPGVRVVRAPCMGACYKSPSCAVGRQAAPPASVERVAAALKNAGHVAAAKAGKDLAAYMADGGYSLLRVCIEGRHSPDQLISALDTATLRGLGGAGFPTGR